MRVSARGDAALMAVEDAPPRHSAGFASRGLVRPAHSGAPASVLRRLTAMVVAGADLREVLIELHRHVPAIYVVADPAGRVLASHGSTGLEEVAQGGRLDDVRHLLSVSGRPRATPQRVPRSNAEHQMTMQLVCGAENLGTLVALGLAPSEAETELIEFGALSASLILAKDVAVTEAEERLRAGLVEELFAIMAPDDRQICRRASALGISIDAQCLVMVARPLPTRLLSLRASLANLAADHAAAAGVIDDALVCVWPGGDPLGAGKALSTCLAAAGVANPTVSVAGPIEGVQGLRGQYGEARASLTLIEALDRGGNVVTAAELRPYTALFRAANADELREFIYGALGELIAHDRRHRGNLVRTLEVYLDNLGHMSRTASALHAHVNTLYQRLERLDRLLGEDWREPQRRLELHLATRLLRISERLSRTGEQDEL